MLHHHARVSCAYPSRTCPRSSHVSHCVHVVCIVHMFVITLPTLHRWHMLSKPYKNLSHIGHTPHGLCTVLNMLACWMLFCRQSVVRHATWHQSFSKMARRIPVQLTCGRWGVCCMNVQQGTRPLSAPPSTTWSMTSSPAALHLCRVRCQPQKKNTQSHPSC